LAVEGNGVVILMFFWAWVDAKKAKREEDVKKQRGNDGTLEHV